MDFDTEKFLSEVYEAEDTDDAIDLVMETISSLLEGLDWKQFDDGMQSLGGPRLFGSGEEVGNPKFEVIDDILAKADPWKMNDSRTLSFLVMTFQNKNKYSQYWSFIEKCRTRFLETGDLKRMTALLRGYI